jgi:hypothetical protein
VIFGMDGMLSMLISILLIDNLNFFII